MKIIKTFLATAALAGLAACGDRAEENTMMADDANMMMTDNLGMDANMTGDMNMTDPNGVDMNAVDMNTTDMNAAGGTTNSY